MKHEEYRGWTIDSTGGDGSFSFSAIKKKGEANIIILGPSVAWLQKSIDQREGE